MIDFETLNPQTPYSPALLDLFRLLLKSPDYARRIRSHYQIFRQTVDADHSHSIQSRTPNRDPLRRFRSHLKS